VPQSRYVTAAVGSLPRGRFWVRGGAGNAGGYGATAASSWGGLVADQRAMIVAVQVSDLMCPARRSARRGPEDRLPDLLGNARMPPSGHDAPRIGEVQPKAASSAQITLIGIALTASRQAKTRVHNGGSTCGPSPSIGHAR